MTRCRHTGLALLLVAGTLVAPALTSPVAAEPVAIAATCQATAPLTPSGTVTVTLPFIGAVTLPYAAIGQPLADALGTQQLPLALPFDVTAPAEVDPGDTLDYHTGLSLDAGTTFDDAIEALRGAIRDLGYPEVADSLDLSVTLDDLTIPFPHPPGTTPTGGVQVSGSTPMTASHSAGALRVVVDELEISTDGGTTAIDAAVDWSMLHGGTPGPATIDQHVDDPTFDLEVAVAVTLPPELVMQLYPDLPFTLTGDVPITMGATGPFACDVGDDALVATTSVRGAEPTAETLLRVTTTPAVPGRIAVDGVPMADWGLDWVAVGAGSHEVCFGPVTGYLTPPCETVEVAEGTTATVDGSYEPAALLQVLVEPAGLPATVHVDGVARNQFGLFSWIEPGEHEVCWGAVDGWGAPACQVIDLTSGEYQQVTGAYAEGGSGGLPDPGTAGQLRVTSSPAVPTEISVDGVPRHHWGLDWLDLAPGDHEVCFGPVTGFGTPPCQTVTVAEDATTSVEGVFSPLGVLQVQVDPAGLAAHVLVDGVARNRFGLLAWTEPGSYEVCWEPMAGYTPPPCETVVVTAPGTAERTGVYSPAP